MRESQNKKIVVIGGTGNIGRAAAAFAVVRNLGDVYLLATKEEKLRAAKFEVAPCIDGDQDATVEVTTDSKVLRGADAVIMVAGQPRPEGRSVTREEMIADNAPLAYEYGKLIGEYAPDTFLVNVINPLDAMTEIMARESGLPDERVVGMAGILDNRRFRTLLSELFDVRLKDVTGHVVGQHAGNNFMIPVFKRVTIEGVPLAEAMTRRGITLEQVEKVAKDLQNMGTFIKDNLRGSAFLSPAAGAVAIVKGYLYPREGEDFKTTASVRPRGVYGIDGDICIGVPVIVNGKGVTPYEFSLSSAEMRHFMEAVNDQRRMNKVAEKCLIQMGLMPAHHMQRESDNVQHLSLQF